MRDTLNASMIITCYFKRLPPLYFLKWDKMWFLNMSTLVSASQSTHRKTKNKIKI